MTTLQNYAQRALEMMDLTSLTNTETDADIAKLCQQAKSVAGNTAAICIYPRFIPLAKKLLILSASLPQATILCHCVSWTFSP